MLVKGAARIKLFFALIGAALTIAALSGSAVSWDGSYQLLTALDTQTPYIPNNRLIVLPAQILVIFTSQFTDNLRILQAVFGLVYAAILFGTLAISWLIVRERAPSVFVWVALGIGIGTLPGQFPIYSEASLVVQLFWPIVVAILTQIQNKHIPIVIFLSVIVMFTHPFSILLFVAASGVAILMGFRHRIARVRMWLWGGAFILFAGLALIRFMLNYTNYEAERLSLDILKETYKDSVAGSPMIGLTLACIMAIMVLITPIIRNSQKKGSLFIVSAVELVSMIAMGIVLVVWASDSHRWYGAIDFRTWTLFSTFSFLSFAAAEGFKYDLSKSTVLSAEWIHRSTTICMVAFIFALVISAQSIGWIKLTNRLQVVIAENQAACIPLSSIEWVGRTPLNHWSISTLSIILQGRSPTKVVLSGSGCSNTKFDKGFPIADFIWHDWDHGWFKMDQLAEKLLSEQKLSQVR